MLALARLRPTAAIFPYALPFRSFGLFAGLWSAVGGAAQRPFFDAAATVIPVLLLTLVVEARFFSKGRLSRPLLGPQAWLASAARFLVWLYAVSALLVLALGEMVALRVLGTAEAPDAADTGVVAAAIVAGFLVIVIAAFESPADLRDDS